MPPYRRSYSAAPAAPYVPPSDVLPAVCCRRAALPPTLTVPRRLYTHTPDFLLDRVCVEERTEPPRDAEAVGARSRVSGCRSRERIEVRESVPPSRPVWREMLLDAEQR